MILDGKAKEDFFETIHEEKFNQLRLPAIQYALIIEWFDSVGIYVLICLDETNKHKFKYLITDKNTRHLHDWREGVNKTNRIEATTEAIIKAKDIYNARK